MQLSRCLLLSVLFYHCHWQSRRPTTQLCALTAPLCCASCHAHAVGSLRKLARVGYTSYTEEPREAWVLRQPAQLVIAVSQIFWCADVEERLKMADPTSGLQDFLRVRRVASMGMGA